MIQVDPQTSGKFTLNIRIPGWARNQPVPGDLYRYMGKSAEPVVLKVKTEIQPLILQKGFAAITRHWEKGDTVELHLPMPVRRVLAHPEIKDNNGRVAIERGPILYCAEWVDNDRQISNLLLPDHVQFNLAGHTGDFNDQVVLKADIYSLHQKGKTVAKRNHPLVMIPYHGWAHRGKGEMTVWLAREKSAVYVKPYPTLSSISEISSSPAMKGISAINDLYEPGGLQGFKVPHAHWWPKKGSLEWVQYIFPKVSVISEAEVYWFDDTGLGECRIPQSWRILYQKHGHWIPVKAAQNYQVMISCPNKVTFTPVKTKSIRLEVQLQKNFSAGILEWKVK